MTTRYEVDKSLINQHQFLDSIDQPINNHSSYSFVRFCISLSYHVLIITGWALGLYYSFRLAFKILLFIYKCCISNLIHNRQDNVLSLASSDLEAQIPPDLTYSPESDSESASSFPNSPKYGHDQCSYNIDSKQHHQYIVNELKIR